jgi:hypothetical protein
MALLSTSRAASLSVSDNVGWAWTVRAMSSALPPNAITETASAISSEARRSDDMDPDHGIGGRIGKDLDESVGHAMASDRPLALKGKLPAV